MLLKVKAILSSLVSKSLSLSGAPAIAVGVAVGYVGHPFIKAGLGLARLLLKI